MELFVEFLFWKMHYLAVARYISLRNFHNIAREHWWIFENQNFEYLRYIVCHLCDRQNINHEKHIWSSAHLSMLLVSFGDPFPTMSRLFWKKCFEKSTLYTYLRIFGMVEISTILPICPDRWGWWIFFQGINCWVCCRPAHKKSFRNFNSFDLSEKSKSVVYFDRAR